MFLNIPAAQAKNITTVCTVPVCIPFEIPHGSVGRLEYLGDTYTKTTPPPQTYLVYEFLNIPAAQAKNITTVCTVPVCIPFEIPRGSVGRLEYLGDGYTKTTLPGRE